MRFVLNEDFNWIFSVINWVTVEDKSFPVYAHLWLKVVILTKISNIFMFHVSFEPERIKGSSHAIETRICP